MRIYKRKLYKKLENDFFLAQKAKRDAKKRDDKPLSMYFEGKMIAISNVLDYLIRG